jgi:hypothetical protein
MMGNGDQRLLEDIGRGRGQRASGMGRRAEPWMSGCLLYGTSGVESVDWPFNPIRRWITKAATGPSLTTPLEEQAASV